MLFYKFLGECYMNFGGILLFKFWGMLLYEFLGQNVKKGSRNFDVQSLFLSRKRIKNVS